MGKTCCTNNNDHDSPVKHFQPMDTEEADNQEGGKQFGQVKWLNPQFMDKESTEENSGHSEKAKESFDKYFKGNMTGKKTEQLVYEKLDQLGFTADNTLFADCSCPDEINHDDPDEDITSLMANRWGEMFPLGGLAGLPFTGRTGWGAFSSHCPIDGHIVVLFAPHVGIDSEGNIGKVTRDG